MLKSQFLLLMDIIFVPIFLLLNLAMKMIMNNNNNDCIVFDILMIPTMILAALSGR